jgi:hypothetical protein
MKACLAAIQFLVLIAACFIVIIFPHGDLGLSPNNDQLCYIEYK